MFSNEHSSLLYDWYILIWKFGVPTQGILMPLFFTNSVIKGYIIMLEYKKYTNKYKKKIKI